MEYLHLQYAALVIKYDRNGYHSRSRVLALTDKTVYILNEKNFKLKDNIPFENLKGIIYLLCNIFKNDQIVILCSLYEWIELRFFEFTEISSI